MLLTKPMSPKAQRAHERAMRPLCDAGASAFEHNQDDMIPMIYAVMADGRGLVCGVPFTHAACKDLAAKIICEFIRQGAVSVSITMTGWRLNKTVEELDSLREFIGRISEHPDAVESLVVNYYSRAGESTATADYIREPGQPIKLAPWEFYHPAESEGRFCNLFRTVEAEKAGDN